MRDCASSSETMERPVAQHQIAPPASIANTIQHFLTKSCRVLIV